MKSRRKGSSLFLRLTKQRSKQLGSIRVSRGIKSPVVPAASTKQDTRAIRSFAVLLVFASAQILIFARPAAALGLNITHPPPTNGFTGENLILTWNVTGDPFQGWVSTTLSWISADGSVASNTQDTSSTCNLGCPFSHTIPGDDVRYPTFHYWFDAYQDPSWHTSLGSQAGPSNVVVVINRLKFSVVEPNGSPASGAEVLYWLPDRDANGLETTYRSTTDANGLATLQIPTDTQITQRALGDKYEIVKIWLFDALPASVPAGQRLNVAGHGLRLGATLNLGEPLFSAVDPLVEGQTFTLQDETVSFGGTGTLDGEEQQCAGAGPNQTCRTDLGDIHSVMVPIAENVGGGSEMKGKISYQDTKVTKLGFAHTLNGGWAEGGTETESLNDVGIEMPGTYRGPNDNKLQYLTWTYTHERETYCYMGGPPSGYCQKKETSYPKEWDGGSPIATISSGLHDQAAAAGTVDSPGPDCTIRMENETAFASGVTKRFQYTLSAGGSFSVGPVNIRVRSVYKEGQEHTVRLKHWFNLNTSANYHHVFVKGGWSANPHMCPNTDTTLAWTDTSTTNKMNPPRPQPGPPPCVPLLDCHESAKIL